MEPWVVGLIVFAVLLLGIIVSGIKVVPQSKAYSEAT